MRFVFLAFANIKYLPFLHFYSDQCDVQQNDIHLVYWNRGLHRDAAVPEGIIPHCFECQMSDEDSIYKKMPCYIRYSRYAKKIIREVKPDKLVIMYASTAITVFPLLNGRYKDKYIFDYRDISHEKNDFYRKLVGRIVENSRMTFTSSDGFRAVLPKAEGKIFTSHNLQRKALALHDSYKVRERRTDEMPVRISMWGYLRHLNINRRIIESIGGDSRFELHYYGTPAGSEFTKMLQCSADQYRNVLYHGEYIPGDVDAFARETDILLNIYDNRDATMPYAMANKFYDGLVYYLPQLCTKGSFMGEKCEQYGVGLACDAYSDSFADDIYSYYKALDRQKFTENCDAALREIMEQVETDEKMIREFFESD